MLDEENQSLKPDEKFLWLLSGEIGSRWPSIALSLCLSKVEVAGLREKVGLTQQELALQMLRTWALREEATYSKLCQSLNTISLFQHLT